MPCLWQNVGTCLWHVEPAGRAVRAGRHRKAMSLHGINPVGPLGWLTSEGAMSLRQSIYVVIGLLYKMVLIPKWFNSLCIMHSTLCITFNRSAKLLHFFHTPALPAVKKSRQPDAKALAGSTGNCKISDLFEKFVFRSRKTEFFAGSHI